MHRPVHNYTDGQKIAKRLSAQISKQVANIRSQLQEYNDLSSQDGSNTDEITLPMALDPATIATKVHLSTTTVQVCSDKRRDVIDAYLTICRCEEELAMLQSESHNVVTYYDKKKQIILDELDSLSHKSDSLTLGKKSLLHRLLTNVEFLLERSQHTVKIISNQTNHVSLEDTGSDIWSDESDSMYSSDDDLDDYQ